MIELINTIIYAGRVKEEFVLRQSSSGGAFTVISDFFLEKGDAVVAAVYNYETYATEFRMIYTKEERDAARGSKYMQSKPGEVFKRAYEWLEEYPDQRLLFVGMGCQADGFRKYVEIKGIRERVYIADIICHGSPSPKLWREYAKSLEHHHHGKIIYLTFKDKRNGWNTPTALVVVRGKEVSIKDYVKVFYNRCALRPSCHECPYASIKRKIDITIGDFWHIEQTIPIFYNSQGNSLFLIHTSRGKKLFEEVKKNLDYKLSNTTQCWQKNLEGPTPVSEKREEFWRDYQRKGIDFIMKKYGTVAFKTKVKNKINKSIEKLGAEISKWMGMGT